MKYDISLTLEAICPCIWKKGSDDSLFQQ